MLYIEGSTIKEWGGEISQDRNIPKSMLPFEEIVPVIIMKSELNVSVCPSPQPSVVFQSVFTAEFFYCCTPEVSPLELKMSDYKCIL